MRSLHRRQLRLEALGDLLEAAGSRHMSARRKHGSRRWSWTQMPSGQYAHHVDHGRRNAGAGTRLPPRQQLRLRLPRARPLVTLQRPLRLWRLPEWLNAAQRGPNLHRQNGQRSPVQTWLPGRRFAEASPRPARLRRGTRRAQVPTMTSGQLHRSRDRPRHRKGPRRCALLARRRLPCPACDRRGRGTASTSQLRMSGTPM